MTDDNTENNKNQEQKLCYIYRHIRLDKDEVFYIGKGTNTDGKYTRSNDIKARNPHWKRIVKKYKHIVEIVIDNLSEQEANEKEKEFIKLYGRRDLGTGTLVNLTDGGDGCCGYIATEETRQKLSYAGKGRFFSEETRKKIGIKHKGKKQSPEAIEKKRLANLGKKHTEEHKRKIGESNKGKTMSDEAKNKISKSLTGKPKSLEHREKTRQANLGKKLSEEHKKKLSEANKGKKNSDEAMKKISEALTGRKLSEEHRLKMIENMPKKRVGQYDKDGIFLKEYPSVSSVVIDGFCKIGVGTCANGRIKTHKGFIWKFL